MWRLSFCVLLAGVAGAADPVVLVENGRSAYSIRLAADASPSQRRGAQELQRFLEEMSGARLPVAERTEGPAIVIQSSGQFGPEGFRLHTSGGDLIISGGRERGAMYGVYTLLEKLGCRWFTPEVSSIPNMRTVRVAPLDEIQKPAFEYREPFMTEAFDKDWAARNKTNGAHSKLDASTGGKLEYYPFVHSFYEMVPPAKYFAAHPEYFSLIDGKRRVDRGQLCLTNPDVLRVSVEAVLEWIRRHPEAAIYSVSQNDWEGWCECDNCQRAEREEGGVHSGPLLRFVNALAAEIEKRHPDKLIDTLAYWYTEDPPSRVRPRPNVRIRLCPIGVCDSHPYGKCPRSAYFMRNLEAWSKITSQLYIWHYNTNFSHYLAPFPDFDQLADTLPLYRRHGVVGVFLEGSYPPGGGGENAELRSYVTAKLLWDPAADMNRLVDEFISGVYGRAAKPMRAYFDLLHRQAREGMHIWINPMPELAPSFLPEARALFRRAEQAADDDTVLRRVRKARLPIDYVELVRAKTFEVEDGTYAPADLAALRDRFQSFLATLRDFGITSIHEGRDLKTDEQEFATLRSFRVTTLENSGWRVDVVPDLGGRAIRMIEKRTGRDLLRRPDAGERSYPDVGGLAAYAYPDFVARQWDVAWALDSATATEVRLRGACANGLRLERLLALTGAGLHTETVAENGGTAPLEAVLQARGDFDPHGIDNAIVTGARQDGTELRKRLIESDRPPTGAETWSAGERPAGEWRVSGILNRFPQHQVERTVLSWSAKGPHRVTLGLWSKKRTLAPGERLRLDADYGRGE